MFRVGHKAQETRHVVVGGGTIAVRINHDLVEQVLAEKAVSQAKARYADHRAKRAA